MEVKQGVQITWGNKDVQGYMNVDWHVGRYEVTEPVLNVKGVLFAWWVLYYKRVKVMCAQCRWVEKKYKGNMGGIYKKRGCVNKYLYWCNAYVIVGR